MSESKKLQGVSGEKESPELTKLKAKWRGMADDAREFWRSLFISQTPQAEIRKQLFTKLKINLGWDSQLTKFRDWELDQRDLDLREERARENERRLIAEHPDWTLEQIRNEVLRRSYLESIARGDHKLGLKTVDKDIKVRSQNFEETKFKESLRDKLQAGLDEVAAAFKKNPQAMEFYKQARALVSREMK